MVFPEKASKILCTADFFLAHKISEGTWYWYAEFLFPEQAHPIEINGAQGPLDSATLSAHQALELSSGHSDLKKSVGPGTQESFFSSASANLKDLTSEIRADMSSSIVASTWTPYRAPKPRKWILKSEKCHFRPPEKVAPKVENPLRCSKSGHSDSVNNFRGHFSGGSKMAFYRL